MRGDKRADRSNPGPGAYYEYDTSPKARDFIKMQGPRTETGSIFGILMKNGRNQPGPG